MSTRGCVLGDLGLEGAGVVGEMIDGESWRTLSGTFCSWRWEGSH